MAALSAACQSDQSFSSSSPEISPCNRLRDFDLPAQRFDETAQALAHASSCFIKADLADIGSTQVPAVSGHLSIAAALSRILAPTDLQVMQHGDTLIVH
ncbi:STN domain-containing protein [Salinisphaera sp. SPP-AMP-43]|uniref:STN domain-containing protein n=1 Tax=Salinisphaera sp. SPP-AMP-43 TaxID=3121288 RepID=UPI003C6E88BF